MPSSMNTSIVRIPIEQLVAKSKEKPTNYLQTLFRLSHVGTYIAMPEQCYDFAVELFSTQTDPVVIAQKTDDFINSLDQELPLVQSIKKNHQASAPLNAVEQAFFSTDEPQSLPESLRSLRAEYLAEFSDPKCSDCKKSSLVRKYREKINKALASA